jgi:hypothetical protein
VGLVSAQAAQNPKPPGLISPKNGASITVPQPTFTWSPPAPSPTGQVTYEVKIVEILPNQTKEEALRTNPVWYEVTSLRTATLSYPRSARALETGKKYAWQVKMVSDGREVNRSEIWAFQKDQACETHWCDQSYNFHVCSDATTLVSLGGPTVVISPPSPCWYTMSGMSILPRYASWIGTSAPWSFGVSKTFTKSFVISDTLKVDSACLELSADDEATVQLNGFGFVPSWPQGLTKHPSNTVSQIGGPHLLSLWKIPGSFFAVSGSNTLVITVTNTDGNTGGLIYSLNIKTKKCPCDTTNKPNHPIILIHPTPQVTCDSFTECCMRLCKGWNTISFPVREYSAPFTTLLGDLLPQAPQHSDVGRLGNIYRWNPPNWANAQNNKLFGIGSQQPTNGYVVYSNCETEYCIAGVPVSSWTRTIRKGWNLIGTVLCQKCPCCCGKSLVGTPWVEPSVIVTKMDGTPLTPIGNYIKGPYYICGDWSLVGPMSVIEAFKGYWVCTQEDSIRLTMTCDSCIPLPAEPCSTCTKTDSIIIPVCTCDNFSTTLPDNNPPTPSQALQNWVAAHYYYSNLRNCDATIIDRYWAHTFTFPTSLNGCPLKAATFIATVKNSAGQPGTDYINLGHITSNASTFSPTDVVSLGANSAYMLNQTVTITWPCTPGLVTTMASLGSLDVTIQDDAAVDS